MRDKLPDPERRELLSLAQPTLWSEDGKDALEYLKNKRGLSDKVVKDFGIGYVPANIESPDGERHEFAGKIIIPIVDHYGNLVALLSRDWREGATRSFFHESFTKSNYIFGLNIAKNEILYKNQVILVEGEFDVTYLHSHSFPWTVGVLGTTLQLYQISILSRYCQEIYVVFDGDSPGRESTEKIMYMGSKYNVLKMFDIKLIPVSLPDNCDPDDFVRENGSNKFNQLLEKSKNNRMERF
jgi:DNA primase